MLGFLLLTADTAAPTALQIVGAWAISTHSIRVELSTPPMAVDQYATGDALNPATWSLTRLDTNAAVMVIAASMFDTVTVDLVTLDPLGDHFVDHEVIATGLLDSVGNPINGANSAVLEGVVHTLDPVDAITGDTFRDRDLANPPFQLDRGLGTSGTILIGPDGDYQTEAGVPLLKKLALRRLGTPRGAFRHLPRYGIGLHEKEPIPGTGDLRRLRADIEAQVLEEPDAESARAALTLDRSGVLIVQLQIKPRGGATINIRMGSVGGRLVEI